MQAKEHWERIYSTKSPDSVSWFQERAEQSLRLIRETGSPRSAAVIDVGGGASVLVEDLLNDGYSDITVLDLSAAALDTARKRLGQRAKEIKWIEADITNTDLPYHAYDIWHDRAVFHFLTSPEQRRTYVDAVMQSVKPGGHVIVATFAEDGPMQCSGLPIVRYSAGELHAEFGAAFTLLQHEKEEHHTPFGTTQKFVYCYCRKRQSQEYPNALS